MCGKDGRGQVCWHCYVNLKNNTFYGLCQGPKQFPTDDPRLCNLCNTCRIGCKVPNYTQEEEKMYWILLECRRAFLILCMYIFWNVKNLTILWQCFNQIATCLQYWKVSLFTNVLWNVFLSLTNNQLCLQTQYIQNNIVAHV